jgi:error-prone DNA polymerase
VEQLLLDYGRVGLSIDDHPMCHVRPHIAHRYVSRAADLAKMPDGRAVRIAGLVIGRQRPGTASGVTFVTLEDETGIMNLVVTLSVWEAHRHTALHAKLVFVHGKLEREGEVIHVLVQKLERLELPTGALLPVRSRDFH